jgi:purine-binding chemotaxis protein CheW
VKAQPGCVVIADIQCDGKSLTIGALVDSVDQVVEITSETIRGAPEVGCHGAKQVIDGIGEVGGEFVVLLDIDQVFADGELHSVQQQAHNSTGSYTRGMAV